MKRGLEADIVPETASGEPVEKRAHLESVPPLPAIAPPPDLPSLLDIIPHDMIKLINGFLCGYPIALHAFAACSKTLFAMATVKQRARGNVIEVELAEFFTPRLLEYVHTNTAGVHVVSFLLECLRKRNFTALEQFGVSN